MGRMRRAVLLLLAVAAGCAPEPPPRPPAWQPLAPRPSMAVAIDSPAPPAPPAAPAPEIAALPPPHDAPPADLRTPKASPSVCPRPAAPTPPAKAVVRDRFGISIPDGALLVGMRIDLRDKETLGLGGRHC